MLAPVLGLVALAFLVRGWLLGDPIIHVDEEFYFLTGGRMLHGSLPYVDIWDRKPVGLFLIYAFAYWASAGSVIGYQLLATISAAATSLLIRQMSLKIAGPKSSWITAAAYLLYLPVFNGAGGQSPVFYNLPMALAALSLMRLADDEGLAMRARGILAMLLVGIAIQIKYTALFEGLFFGLWLLWSDWKRGSRFSTIATNGLIWAGLALLPTALAWASFAMLGHSSEFVQANFLSVLSRHEPIGPSLQRLFWWVVDLSPLLILVALSWKPLKLSIEGRFILGWMATAVTFYLLFGNYYDHYALPLLVPFCVAAAAGLERGGFRRNLATLLLVAGFSIGTFTAVRHRLTIGSAADVDRLASLIRPNLHGCMFVYEGHAILYEKTNACFVTRYVFPYHLSAQKEAGALGVDVMSELARIRAARPSVVVIAARPRTQTNISSRRHMLSMLREDYRFLGSAPTGSEDWLVYGLRTSPSPPEERVPRD